MGGVFLRALVGLGAGLLGWAVIEPTRPATLGPEWSSFEQRMMIAVGLLLGLSLGGLSGWARGSRRHFFSGLALGGLFGLVGVLSGYVLGGILSAPLTGMRIGPGVIIWRVIAIAPVGMGIGAGIGGSTLNARRFLQGGIGGLLGGAAAGLAFDTIGAIFAGPLVAAQTGGTGGEAEVGGPARAITFALIGAMVGLFIGLVERIARVAWVRLVLGKNEGREFSLDSAVTHIGRDERAGIPLWGDPNVAPLHATITRQGPHYVLQDHGSPVGTVFGGQRIGQIALNPGTIFQIGRHTLEFLTKGGPRASAVPMAGPVGPVGTPLQPISVQGVPTQGFAAPVPLSAPTISVPAAKEAVLVAIDGPLAGARVVFADSTEIGREGGALPLSFDRNVSRRHARLSIAPGGLLVEDLGSTNGTLVNGAKIDRTFVRSQDVVKIGLTSFRVEKTE